MVDHTLPPKSNNHNKTPTHPAPIASATVSALHCHMWLDLTSGCFSLLTRRPSPWFNLEAQGRDFKPGGRGRPAEVPQRWLWVQMALDDFMKSLELVIPRKDAFREKKVLSMEQLRR